MKADIKTADRGEPVTLMEPLLIGSDSRHRAALTDLAFDLNSEIRQLRGSLPPAYADLLANLVRATNCYYSTSLKGTTHRLI
jgi:hypothetical protein